MNSCNSMYCHGGYCTCGHIFYNNYQKPPFDEYYSENNMYSSPSSSVDCTLSLGTPSTRLSNNNNNNNENEEKQRVHHDQSDHERRRSSNNSSYMSKCWNILQSKSSSVHKSSRGSSHGNNNNSSGGDPLVARRCANCDTTSTPLWRNGPKGPKSLCNACGIRFKKEERRAAAATANGGGMGGGNIDGSWIHHNSQPQKMPNYYSSTNNYGNEFRFIEDDDRADSDTSSIPFWPFMAPQHC